MERNRVGKRWRRWLRLAISGAGVVPLAGCTLLGASPLPLLELERGWVHIETGRDTVVVEVEIAQTAGERAIGLMEREELAENAGMIFLFEGDRPSSAGFYMYRTWIPLDIAYADAAGRIVAIRTMEPCRRESWLCPSYPPGAPYRFALEVNAGYLAAHEVAVGDRLVLVRKTEDRP